LPHDVFGFVPQVASDGFDIPVIYGHCGAAAAIGASGAVNLLLYLRCEYLKRLDSMVVSREIPAKIPIFRLLCCSQAPDLDEIGEHAFSILLMTGEEKGLQALQAWILQINDGATPKEY
jgi:hypothetical protein